VLPGSEQSTEFAELLHRFSRDDLTTISMMWHLEKEGGTSLEFTGAMAVENPVLVT
jgi:hypothetical protein